MSGCEWIIDAHGCDQSALRDIAHLTAVIDEIVAALSLHPVAQPVWHRFPEPGGVTGVCLLSESHVAFHTFPEFRSLCLNVFCCRPRPDMDFAACLTRTVGASSVHVRRVDRPYRDWPFATDTL